MKIILRDTKNVTNMSLQMFYNATDFGNISNWDTSSVIYMNWMFGNTDSFNPFGNKNINKKVVENVRINSNEILKIILHGTL